MDVFSLCELALSLIRGRTLAGMDSADRASLEALDWEALATRGAQQEAVSCARSFATTRDRLLSSHPWQCARRRTYPAQHDDPERGFRYAYALPADCLKVLAVIRASGSSYTDLTTARAAARFDVSRGRVSCLWPQVELIYTARIAPQDWDVHLTDAFAWSLAAAICPSVTGEPQTFQMMEQGAQLRIQEARACGAIQMPTSIQVERYGWHGLTDRFDPMYCDGEEPTLG